MSEMRRCAYCKGSGEDRYHTRPCQACGGSGQILVPYDNAVKCMYCKGSGEDRYKQGPCNSCGGAGVTAPGIQSL